MNYERIITQARSVELTVKMLDLHQVKISRKRCIYIYISFIGIYRMVERVWLWVKGQGRLSLQHKQ